MRSGRQSGRDGKVVVFDILLPVAWNCGEVLERVDIQVVHMKALTIARIERNARGV